MVSKGCLGRLLKTARIAQAFALVAMLALQPEAAFASGAQARHTSTTQFSNSLESYNSHWASGYINLLAQLGIAHGDAGGMRPDYSITRAEFVALVNRSFGFEAPAGTVVNFPDVAYGSWYYGAFATARYVGIIEGNHYGNATPGANITRAEVATILNRALQAAQLCDAGNFSGTSVSASQAASLLASSMHPVAFADHASIPSWAASSASNLQNLGIIHGFEDGSFRPQQALTRGEGFAMLARMIVSGHLPEYCACEYGDEANNEYNANNGDITQLAQQNQNAGATAPGQGSPAGSEDYVTRVQRQATALKTTLKTTQTTNQTTTPAAIITTQAIPPPNPPNPPRRQAKGRIYVLLHIYPPCR